MDKNTIWQYFWLSQSKWRTIKKSVARPFPLLSHRVKSLHYMKSNILFFQTFLLSLWISKLQIICLHAPNFIFFWGHVKSYLNALVFSSLSFFTIEGLPFQITSYFLFLLLHSFFKSFCCAYKLYLICDQKLWCFPLIFPISPINFLFLFIFSLLAFISYFFYLTLSFSLMHIICKLFSLFCVCSRLCLNSSLLPS